MPKCSYCNTRIVFGGKKHGDLRFCNNECMSNGLLEELSAAVPDQLVEEEAWRLFELPCPRCNKRSPTEVFSTYRLISILLICNTNADSFLACRRCATKRQSSDLLVTMTLGLWQIPWGPILTVLFIARNIDGMTQNRKNREPSDGLREVARLALADRYGNDLITDEMNDSPI